MGTTKLPRIDWDDGMGEAWLATPRAWRALEIVPPENLRGGEGKVGVVLYRKREQQGATDEQIAELDRFVRAGPKLVDLVLRGIFDGYGPTRTTWIANDPDGDIAEHMPALRSPSQLRTMLEVTNVYLHDVVKNGRAYIGIAFRSSWDPEHGAGVMLHGDRVVAARGHDMAMLEWVAERDARQKKKGGKKRATKKATKKKAKRKSAPRSPRGAGSGSRRS